jgi:hypothetical protein
LISLEVQGILAPTVLQQITVTALAGSSVLLALRAADFAPRLLALGMAVASIVLALCIVRGAPDRSPARKPPGRSRSGWTGR